MSDRNTILQTPEIELQRHVQRLISDPAKVLKTESQKRLQILSPGELNVHEGPDFLDSAVLIEGIVNVGDIEFHKKASDWQKHKHGQDKNYKNVILHIVVENDNSDAAQDFETLVLDLNELEKVMLHPEKEITTIDEFSLEDLQHFALIRLLRKSAEIQKSLNSNGLQITLNESVSDYLKRYNSRRKRPVYNEQSFEQILTNLKQSAVSEFLGDIQNQSRISMPDRLHELLKTKIAEEGAHLRREIMLNCILPLAICLAGEESRISLFLWYWSTPALHSYGILTRKFPSLPQNFLWEQQGMLEYMKEFGKRPNVVRDAIKTYGFAEILSFYRLGRAPFNYSEDLD